MIVPALPLNEIPRQKALERLAILDTPREERFDRILRLAVRLFRVPMATISLLDGNRQWFKSRIGIEADGTPRDISFCGHAILGDQAMVVPDALADIRFSDNPLVTGGPQIRFYAGQPLKLAGGNAIGVLCIMDRQPRELDPEELASLADLAALVEKELGGERVPELYTRVSLAESESREAVAAKRRFLSKLTHDLRTPMNGVLGMCQLMMDGRLDAAQRDGLEIIRESSENFLTVIDDLLDFANLGIGAAVGRSERFKPYDTLLLAVNPFKAECAKKGLRMVVDLAENLPPCLIGDAGRLRQIVVNLIGNAVQFTHQGMVRLEAQWLAGREGEGELLIRVVDSGRGIRADRIPELFSGFSPIDGSPTGGGAAGGLGLAITKRLVDSMQGGIQVVSIPGKGSNFIVKVKLAVASDSGSRKDYAATAPNGAASPIQAGMGPVPVGKERPQVLLVEDSLVNQKVAKRMLEKLGLRVDLAATGVEALNLVARNAYAAIFMDCQMPDMDGYEATRAIRGSRAPWADLPIIAITAFASPESREECLRSGMDDHIAKPIRFDVLESAVRRYVRK